MDEITFHFKRRCKIALRSRFIGREEFSQTRLKAEPVEMRRVTMIKRVLFSAVSFFSVNEFTVVHAGRPVLPLPAGC